MGLQFGFSAVRKDLQDPLVQLALRGLLELMEQRVHRGLQAQQDLRVMMEKSVPRVRQAPRDPRGQPGQPGRPVRQEAQETLRLSFMEPPKKLLLLIQTSWR